MSTLVSAYNSYLKPLFTTWQMVMGILLTPLEMAWNAISDGISWAWENVISPVFDALTAAVEWVADLLEPVLDAIDSIGDFIGGGIDAVGGMLGFAEGGIATGPSSGYPVTLHGTEAVVPLPNGRSIPVEMTGGGGGGGGGNTFNISINASGMTDRTDKREFARQISNAIQQEISRASGGSTMRSGR
jgi:hypothetical protein